MFKKPSKTKKNLLKRATLITFLLVVVLSFIAITKAVGTNVSCSAKNTVTQADGTCKCKGGFLWNEKKQYCTNSIVYCSDTYAKRSVYDRKTGECKCRNGFDLNTSKTMCVKVKPPVTYTQVTLDDSDMENGSAQYDFETGKKTVYGDIDLFLSGMIYESTWMPSLDWQVVEMTDKTLDEVKECPADGYASLDDPDGDGWGSPRYADEGHAYCLKTAEGNYVKLEILYARYESDTDLRVLKFKYFLQKNGSRIME